MPTIVPIRHPYRVAESWKRRGKGEGQLIHNYQLLIDHIAPHNPFYITVDSHTRDDQIDQINESLDLNLEKTWPILNSKHETHSLPLGEPSPDIEEFFNQAFFKQFY